MIWFLWTAGTSIAILAATAVLVLWDDAAAHRRAEKLRVSAYLAKLADD